MGRIVGACEAMDLLMDLIVRLPTLLPLYERLRGPCFQARPAVAIGSKPTISQADAQGPRPRLQQRSDMLRAFESRDVSLVGKVIDPMSYSIKRDWAFLATDALPILADADRPTQSVTSSGRPTKRRN